MSRLDARRRVAGISQPTVDPGAPDEPRDSTQGPVFHRRAFEEVDLAAGSFDIGIACMSLRHVDDLAPVLNKALALLRPSATLIVAEFGWERIDEPTGRWYAANLPTAPCDP